MNKRRLKDFILFSNIQISSGDIDPTYPVLKKVCELERLDSEGTAWRVLLYLTWYNLLSSEYVFKRHPKFGKIPKVYSHLATGVERRGFRGNNKGSEMINNLVDTLRDRRMTLMEWFTSISRPTETNDGWTNLREEIETIKHNGNWASFKCADLVKNIIGISDIKAPDIGVGGNGQNAGPVPGLQVLTGLDYKTAATNIGLQTKFFNQCRSLGAKFQYMEELETCLCDYNTMLKGGYYSGHDIDIQQVQLQNLPSVWMTARRLSFPSSYLGELNGWCGTRKELNGIYKNTGRIHGIL